MLALAATRLNGVSLAHKYLAEIRSKFSEELAT